MGKFVKFTNEGKSVTIDGTVYPTIPKTVTAPVRVRPLNGVLPKDFPTSGAVKKIDLMYDIPQDAKAALKKKLDDAKTRNEGMKIESWAETEPYTSGVSASIQNAIQTMKTEFAKENITLHLKKYTTTKNAPQWYVSLKDSDDRTSRGLPISVKKFMKVHKGKLDIFTLKGLRALQRLNASMKMWKQYSRFVWARTYHLKNDPDAQKKYIGAKFRKRAKQVIRKLARKTGKPIEQVTKADFDSYDSAAQQKVERQAQANALAIIKTDKETRASAVAPGSFNVNNGVLQPSVDNL